MGLEPTMSSDKTSFELFSTFHTAGRVVGFNVQQHSNILVSKGAQDPEPLFVILLEI